MFEGVTRTDGDVPTGARALPKRAPRSLADDLNERELAHHVSRNERRRLDTYLLEIVAFVAFVLVRHSVVIYTRNVS
jgi:hypothetical protein